MRVKWRRFGVVVLCLLLLEWLDLNTLMLHINTYVPNGSTTDYHHFHWNYWWMRYALQHGLPIYTTQHVLFPLGDVSLGLHTLTPFWFPLWAVLQPLLGYITAFNVLVWLGMTLGGVCMFALLKEYTPSTPLALLGAAAVMVLPLTGRAAELAHLNLMGIFFIPLTLWVWRRIVFDGRWFWAVVLGLVFWAMWLMDTMWLLFVPLVLAPYGLWTLFTQPAARWRQVLLGAAAVLLFVALSYALLPYRQISSFDRSTLSAAGRDAAALWSVPPKMFLLQPGDARRGHTIGHVFMLLFVLSVFRRGGGRERWLWFFASLPGLVLAVGPDIEIGGARITLPYWLLHQAMNGVFRTPERFLSTFFVPATLFIVLSWQGALQGLRLRPRLALFVPLFLVVVGDLRVFYPVDASPPYQVYEFHRLMGREPYDYVLMEVPVMMSSGWTETNGNPKTQFYTLTHGKRVVNAHVSRVPDFYHYYYANEAVLGWLGGSLSYQEGVPEILRGYVNAWWIGYLVAYQDLMGRAAERTQDTIGYLNSFEFLCPLAIERDAVLYRTEAHPQFADCPPRRPTESAPNTWEVDWGTTGDEIYLGRGWHRQEIIGGPSGRWLGAYDLGYGALYIDLPPGADYTLTLEATAFDAPQRLQVVVNGQAVGEFVVSNAGYHPYSVTIPATALADVGSSYIQLFYATTTPAADLRPLAVAVNWLRFEEIE